MSRAKRFLALIVLAGLWLAACSTADAGLPPVEIELVASDIAFSTTALNLTAGQTVRLTIKNTGALEHDFSIDDVPLTGEVVATGGLAHGHEASAPDADVHLGLAPGTTGTIEFTPAAPGAYQFYCTVSGHKEAGMAGTLTVVSP